MSDTISWEQAVKRLRSMPEHADLVRDAYFDEDNLAAAKRFAAGEEFREVLAILKRAVDREAPWDVLDMGAGNGIAAYAFAQAGHRVTALEPDPSDDVGAGAVRRLSVESGCAIDVLENPGEVLPSDDGVMDVVYVRQALHHAADLPKLLKEANRVLRRGGCLLATREHVVDDDDQLQRFLESHPLHKWYGGENAYRLDEYEAAIKAAGFTLLAVLGPFDSVINHFPISIAGLDNKCRAYAQWKLGTIVGGVVGAATFYQKWCRGYLSKRCKEPGRLYSFLARKA